MSTVHVLAVPWCMEKEGWRKLIWSDSCKPGLLTATESFYLILQLCKIQLSLEEQLSSLVEVATWSNRCPLLVVWHYLSPAFLAPSCFSACCWCCFWLEKWFGGASLPGSWWCKAPILHMLWACLCTSPLRNCLQPSWVCAFGLVGSWPKLWSHEEAYEVYFGTKYLWSRKEAKENTGKMVQMRSNFFIYTLCYCSGLWI